MSQLIYPYEAILQATSVTALSAAVRDAAHQLGFSSFHYGAHAPVKADGERARFIFDGTEQKHGGVISSYPESWFERYQSENYIEIDPLVTHCSRSIVPVIWHQQPAPDSKRVKTLFQEATEHGLAAGATFSVIGRSSELAIFSLTSERSNASERRRVESRLAQGYMLLAYLHESVCRLGLPVNHAAHKISLTRREAEVLNWVSAGKTSWEISRILGLAEATVIFHISNASRKLQTTTRTQAVARALALGLLQP